MTPEVAARVSHLVTIGVASLIVALVLSLLTKTLFGALITFVLVGGLGLLAVVATVAHLLTLTGMRTKLTKALTSKS